MPPFVRGWRPRWRRTLRAIHFVTWRLAPGQRPLSASERGVVCDLLHRGDGDRHRLAAYVVMDDHVHVLVEPLSVSLDRLVDSWKSSTGHQLQRLHGRRSPVWQDESLDRPVEGQDDLRERADYIVGNPWKRWPFIQGYPWVWEAQSGGRKVE